MANETKFTPGELVFEPHGLFGKPWPAGVEIDTPPPFGYVSKSAPRVPVFELNPFLKFDPIELLIYARLFAAAPDMYAAIQDYLRFYDAYDGSADSYVAMNDAVEALRAALARANGEG